MRCNRWGAFRTHRGPQSASVGKKYFAHKSTRFVSVATCTLAILASGLPDARNNHRSSFRVARMDTVCSSRIHCRNPLIGHYLASIRLPQMQPGYCSMVGMRDGQEQKSNHPCTDPFSSFTFASCSPKLFSCFKGRQPRAHSSSAAKDAERTSPRWSRRWLHLGSQ